MPVDHMESSDFAHSSASGTQHEYVDDCGRLMRGSEEVPVMEPSPHKLNLGDEFRGFVKEKWGRLMNDDLMVKEGLAIEKGTHVKQDRERMAANLDKFLEMYNLPSARAIPARRHTQ